MQEIGSAFDLYNAYVAGATFGIDINSFVKQHFCATKENTLHIDIVLHVRSDSIPIPSVGKYRKNTDLKSYFNNFISWQLKTSSFHTKLVETDHKTKEDAYHKTKEDTYRKTKAEAYYAMGYAMPFKYTFLGFTNSDGKYYNYAEPFNVTFYIISTRKLKKKNIFTLNNLTDYMCLIYEMEWFYQFEDPYKYSTGPYKSYCFRVIKYKGRIIKDAVCECCNIPKKPVYEKLSFYGPNCIYIHNEQDYVKVPFFGDVQILRY